MLALAASSGLGTAANGIYGFEDGTAQLWELSTQPGETAATALFASDEVARSGVYSLGLDLTLDPTVEAQTAAVAAVMHPGDMTGRVLSAYVRCGPGAHGQDDRPNGFQLFVKDQRFRAQYGEWINLASISLWRQATLPIDGAYPQVAHTDAGFDAAQVMLVGVKIAVNSQSEVSWTGRCWIDLVSIPTVDPAPLGADYRFDFDALDPAHFADRRFGYGPYWDADPDWGAAAWGGDDLRIDGGRLVATASFDVVPDDPEADPEPTRKGYAFVHLQPRADLANKDHRRLQLDLKLEPPVGIDRMLASLWIEQDGRRWRSREVRVGGLGWNRLTFDLDDPDAFGDGQDCPDCQPFATLDARALANLRQVGLQLYAKQDFQGEVLIDNVGIGGVELPGFVNLKSTTA